MCSFMGFRVNRVFLIKLIQIEKELGTLAALEVFVNMHWEFIPWWIKNMVELVKARKLGIPWLNATSEKLLSGKMFRDAALKRRCLVLVSHFYEWRHYKPEGSKKDIAYPYCIHLQNRSYFYLAGIWQPWTDKETGETLDTFAIITTSANSLMEQVHNKKKRMPTILTEELAYEWILGDPDEKRIQEIASFQFPAGEMEAYTIRKDFKTIEDPTKAFTYDELPAI